MEPQPRTQQQPLFTARTDAPITPGPVHIRFDSRQEFQLDAIQAVVDLFQGQPQALETFELRRDAFGLAGVTDAGVGNRLALSREQMLPSLHEVQARNGLPLTDSLKRLDFSVEMETGTGKTYVYLRTLFELHARYGFTKFIILVPSVAVREGVTTSLGLMREHFRELYNRVPMNAWVYDSSRLTQVRQFVHSNQLQLMVVNIDAFKTEKTLMRRESDRFAGGRPIDLIARCNPIVVLDEPQNFGSEGSQEAIARLNPLVTLRYSATHREAPNLVYRLDPVRAYELGLVKKIEVDAVLDDPDFNRPYIALESIQPKGGKITAKVTVDVAGARGPVRKAVTLSKNGDDLFVLTKEREPYRGYVVDTLDAGHGYVRFANGVTVSLGASHGSRREDVMRVQIRQTIRRHLDKELTVRGFKPGERLKVLSLFFIDRVAHFVGDDPKIRACFDEEYEALREDARYLELALPEAARVRAHYFASSPKKGGGEDYKDTSGSTKADEGAYDLIMKDKVRLLSLDEPVRFIFSHSALREGWDNPNVFQICTLNESRSELKKRQEIGRGLRLPVNERGERSRSGAVNRLTIIANEHYQEFAEALQKELRDEWGTTRKVPVEDVRKRRKVKLKKAWHLDDHFRELWAKISPKTRYSVHFETSKLIEKAVEGIQKMPKVEPVKIRVEGSDLTLTAEEIKTRLTSITQVELTPDLLGVPDVLSFLQRETELTRTTLAEILTRSGRVGDLLVNPQVFMDQALRVIRQELRAMMVSGVKYERIEGEAWEMLLFEAEELESYTNRLLEVKRSIVEEIEFDSEVERNFALALDARDDVLFFLKLPRWFRVPTPVGEYVPDWAIVMNDAQGAAKLYLVRETKSTWEQMKLRGVEWAKVESARMHFKLLDVDFDIATDARQLGERRPSRAVTASAAPVDDALVVAELGARVEREDPTLPGYLADWLERDDLRPAWRDALIFAVEHTQVADPELRRRVIAALLKHARALRAEGAREPLWSALRRYASMVPVAEADALLEFLEDGNASLTVHATLQSIFHLFEHEPPSPSPAWGRLVSRVHELATRAIDADRVRTSDDAAFAWCCFQAAAALGDPALGELTTRLEGLGRRRLVARAQELREVLATRRTRTGSDR